MIKDGIVLTRNNDLLAGILSRQPASFSQALTAVTQSNRDQLNLQAGQEKELFAERRFLTNLAEDKFKDRRNFKETVFQDRRNFSRKVKETDRDFTEGVRRFNATDANADDGRAIQRERLGFEGRRLKIAEDGAAENAALAPLRRKTLELRLANEGLLGDQNKTRFDRENELVTEFRSIRDNPDTSEEEKVILLKDVSLQAEAAGFKNIAGAATRSGAEILLPALEEDNNDKANSANEINSAAQFALDEGDLDQARLLFSQAAAISKDIPGAEDVTARAITGLTLAEEIQADLNRDTQRSPDGKTLTPNSVSRSSGTGNAANIESARKSIETTLATHYPAQSITELTKLAATSGSATEFVNSLNVTSEGDPVGDSSDRARAAKLYQSIQTLNAASGITPPAPLSPEAQAILDRYKK